MGKEVGNEEGSNSKMGMKERREVGDNFAKGREEEKQASGRREEEKRASGRRMSGALKEPPQSMAR